MKKSLHLQCLTLGLIDSDGQKLTGLSAFVSLLESKTGLWTGLAININRL